MQLKNKWTTFSFSIPQKSHLTSTSVRAPRKAARCPGQASF